MQLVSTLNNRKQQNHKMKESQNQFLQEHTEWERRLEFITQENALLKFRLSEMVDVSEDKGFLELAENFQNELLLIDEKLQNLIKELKSLSHTFKQSNSVKEKEQLIKQHSNLRKSISQVAEEFLHFTNQFNKKMLFGIKI